MTDFKDPNNYLEPLPNTKPNNNSNNDNPNKISQTDINAFVMQEDYEDILRNQKKTVW
jgi:hypothetical protein